MPPRHRRHPPPWWPANEPWPPVSRRHGWRRGRSRFMRRVGGIVAVLLILSAVGAASLVSVVVGHTSIPGASPRLFALAAIVAILSVSATFVNLMRRVGSPLGDVVEAADRVATGDFNIRVIERGPPPLRSVARAFNSMTADLQSQDQHRRHLMADIAHELRTPLTVIQGRLEGLLDGVYPRDDAHLIEVLGDIRLMSRLIDDLRTLANAESGTLSLQKEPTDLVILIHDVVNSFSSEARAGHVAMHVGELSIPPLVEIDPLRIRETLGNILSNALRHTPHGGTITITAEMAESRVLVTVKDSGIGIAPDELPRIFDRFHKGQASRGSGLGLTIARSLVVAHGGEIRAESRPNEGTTMSFTLPLERA